MLAPQNAYAGYYMRHSHTQAILHNVPHTCSTSCGTICWCSVTEQQLMAGERMVSAHC